MCVEYHCALHACRPVFFRTYYLLSLTTSSCQCTTVNQIKRHLKENYNRDKSIFSLHFLNWHGEYNQIRFCVCVCAKCLCYAICNHPFPFRMLLPGITALLDCRLISFTLIFYIISLSGKCGCQWFLCLWEKTHNLAVI